MILWVYYFLKNRLIRAPIAATKGNGQIMLARQISRFEDCSGPEDLLEDLLFSVKSIIIIITVETAEYISSIGKIILFNIFIFPSQKLDC